MTISYQYLRNNSNLSMIWSKLLNINKYTAQLFKLIKHKIALKGGWLFWRSEMQIATDHPCSVFSSKIKNIWLWCYSVDEVDKHKKSWCATLKWGKIREWKQYSYTPVIVFKMPRKMFFFDHSLCSYTSRFLSITTHELTHTHH